MIATIYGMNAIDQQVVFHPLQLNNHFDDMDRLRTAMRGELRNAFMNSYQYAVAITTHDEIITMSRGEAFN